MTAQEPAEIGLAEAWKHLTALYRDREARVRAVHKALGREIADAELAVSRAERAKQLLGDEHVGR